MNKTQSTNPPPTIIDSLIAQAQKILQDNYSRRLIPEEEGGYSASIMEFPGLVAEGDSADEALQNLNLAAESWIVAHLANGESVRPPVDFIGASGKIALRIPRGLHKQVCELAELEDASINQLLTFAIAEYVGRTTTLKTLEATILERLNTPPTVLNAYINFSTDFNQLKSVIAPPLPKMNFLDSFMPLVTNVKG
ncbi:toxin-antitoxin system HicB family antitoxin [Janthinobacterium sp. Mn2066]|uniref:toxin-antitoxin system HicB family antitoxin n=1 Tax=Janthinobacterium sp. Mn2066 TaxID=3395264 RepID=UPI003BDBAA2C